MCLGIPGRVLETWRDHEILMGKVDFDGVTKRVCLEHVQEVTPGDYVLVHVGFALSQIDEIEAQRVFAFLAGMEQLEELEVPSLDERPGSEPVR
ncbi:MAG: HypC/HybG/HupF family hydrogenase formation chaperone [Acidobacteria bacterium]|nr:HypC/HybG/HupF family hydrogenase formation chaperone [Acidobacteriota bacterium]